MIQKYEEYLDKIGFSLDKFFTQQKDYICCKEGCSICCETGEYPFSELEFKYAMVGFNSLPENTKQLILENIQDIKGIKQKSSVEPFTYKCPFLIGKACSIYNHRGLICRSYGLMYYTTDSDGNDSFKMPCCVELGLNFSNVYDAGLKTISSAKWKESGIEQEPISYNVGLKFLMNNKTVEALGLNFGQQKALIDWFEA